MTENSQGAPNPRRVDDHVGAAASPEKHLLEAHKLSIQVQGKEGCRGHAVWSLDREVRGKVKTLRVFEGTRLEAAHHFFHYIHPDRIATPSAPARRPMGTSSSRPRTGRPQSRPQGRPSGTPQGRPAGTPQGRA